MSTPLEPEQAVELALARGDEENAEKAMLQMRRQSMDAARKLGIAQDVWRDARRARVAVEKRLGVTSAERVANGEEPII